MNEKNVRSIPELFGSMVFSQAQMRQRLPERVYDAWQQCLIQGTSLDRSIADEIAAAMKDWAIEKGATHYTHWFQPMTGFTAEKHDSFIAPNVPGTILIKANAVEVIIPQPLKPKVSGGGGCRRSFAEQSRMRYNVLKVKPIGFGKVRSTFLFCASKRL